MTGLYPICRVLPPVLILVMLPLTTACRETANAASDEPAIEPEVREVIQALSDYYRQARTLQTEVETAMRVKAQGMDTTMSSTYQFALQRPNRIALILKSGMMGATMISDGKHFYVHLPMMNQYTMDEAPATLDDLGGHGGMMAMAMGGGGAMFLQPLLAPDPAEALLEDVNEARHAGTVEIDGARAHHLKLKQDQFDSQLWVLTGDRPLIHKISVDMSRVMAEAGEDTPAFMKGMEMQIDVAFRNWKVNEDLPPETFRFEPPEDAEKVDSFFAGLLDQEPHALLGQEAPPLKLKLLDGGQFDLAVHKGRDIVILDFWATWCPPCVRALPGLIEIADEYRERNVVLYAVNQEETPQTIRRFLERRKLSVKVPLDDDGQAGEAYQVEGLPQTVMIGKDGIIHLVHVGAASKTELREDLDALLAGRNLAAEKKAKHAADKEQRDDPEQDHPDTQPATRPAALAPAWSARGKWDAVAAQGSMIFVAGVGGQAAELDDQGQPQREFKVGGGVNYIRLANLTDSDRPDLLAFRTWGPAVTATHADGKQLWSYPGGQGVNDVWPADLTGDGRDEVIVGYNGGTGLHVLDHRGELLWKYTQIGNVWHVCAGNVNGEDGLEVITTSAQGRVHVFDARGKRIKDLDPGLYANMVRAARVSADDTGVHLLAGGTSQGNREAMVLMDFAGRKKWTLDLAAGDGHIDSAAVARSRPLAAVGLRGGMVRVVDLSRGRVIAEASGQGQRPQVDWSEPGQDRPPLLLVATGRALNAFHVAENAEEE
jgi:peroxiredoxin